MYQLYQYSRVKATPRLHVKFKPDNSSTPFGHPIIYITKIAIIFKMIYEA